MGEVYKPPLAAYILYHSEEVIPPPSEPSALFPGIQMSIAVSFGVILFLSRNFH